MVEPLTLAFLGGAGLVAGFVDAIAGGGGLIALPALLSTGMPPISALATNKVQSVFGTTMAAVMYWRRGHLNLRMLLPAIATTFMGSFVGALAVKSIDTSALKMAVPVALIAIALYFWFGPKITNEVRVARLNFARFVPLLGFIVGFYDGILGPGTGSFFTTGFVALFGLGLLNAAANTKLLNVTSNLAALALFIPAGDVIWPLALVMAVGQLVGGYLGALTGIRFGASLIRPLVVVVSIIMALRLLFAG